jgi:60 kDa SS-A/Ro ribonucleoprotein
MSYQAYTTYTTKATPQSEPIPGSNQVPNTAGGHSFEVDIWTRLNRFLILGTEGGTYYIRQKELTKKNAKSIRKCILEDGKRVVDTVLDISDSGRAVKNDPALFVLAMCAGLGDDFTRKYALTNLPKIARIGTHLFHFAGYVEQFRGWGRGLRKAIANWYLLKETDKLAYQSVKYQQRDGWSHKDLLRLSHPSTQDANKDLLFEWVTKGYNSSKEDEYKDSLSIIWAFEKVKSVQTDVEAAKLVEEYKLPLEAVPSTLKTPKVLETALPHLGLTAIIRNLGNYTKHGILSPQSDALKLVTSRITDKGQLQKARIHPLSVLQAMQTYKSGKGLKGSGEWEVSPQIVDALDDAFYLSFDNIIPTNKRVMLALDVSSSMTWSGCGGMPSVTPRVGSAAMAMVTMRTESDYLITGFTSSGGWSESGISILDLSPKMRLDDVCDRLENLNFGGTDCSLPMKYALENNLKFDAFVVYTDSETWAGESHPVEALRDYRKKTGIPAKLIVVGMEANDFTIADPDDAGMLDVVGFDTTAPSVMSDFIREDLQ